MHDTGPGEGYASIYVHNDGDHKVSGARAAKKKPSMRETHTGKNSILFTSRDHFYTYSKKAEDKSSTLGGRKEKHDVACRLCNNYNFWKILVTTRHSFDALR